MNYTVVSVPISPNSAVYRQYMLEVPEKQGICCQYPLIFGACLMLCGAGCVVLIWFGAFGPR